MKVLIMRQRHIVATLLITAIGGVAVSALAAEPAATPDTQKPPGIEAAQPMPAAWCRAAGPARARIPKGR